MFFVIPEMPSKTFVMLKKNFLITLSNLHIARREEGVQAVRPGRAQVQIHRYCLNTEMQDLALFFSYNHVVYEIVRFNTFYLQDWDICLVTFDKVL